MQKHNLTLELKAKEAKAEAIRIKNTPPPVEEAAPEAPEAAADGAAEEATSSEA
jgi:hypothetical protein